jgi:hypothetical protein
VYQYWWRICREIIFFQVQISYIYVLYPFVSYLRLCLVFATIKFSCTQVFCVKSTCNTRQHACVNIIFFLCKQ